MVEGRWSLSLYPQAGEAGGCLVVRRRSVSSGRRPDPERSRDEGNRRARGKLRRFCAANRLTRLVTLTYAGEGCFDPYAFRAHVAEFFRGLRGEIGERFAYAWVPEWHPGGHGLHAHVAVGRFVPRGMVEEVWGRGFIKIKLIGDLPVGSGALQEARVVGGYLAKYVSKDFGAPRIEGLHRYEVAQRFQPERILVYGLSAEDAIERASRCMGAAPSYVWLSPREGWRGPPACWARWE